MDKRKLIAETARKNNYTKWEVNKIADSFLESITDALSHGEDIHLESLADINSPGQPRQKFDSCYIYFELNLLFYSSNESFSSSK